jgi:hypothetical protein
MTFTVTPRIVERIVERAVDECVFRSVGVMEALTGPDGEVYGDLPLLGADFIASYNDLAARGVLEMLDSIDQSVGSNHAESMRREYDRQFAKGVA